MFEPKLLPLLNYEYLTVAWLVFKLLKLVVLANIFSLNNSVSLIDGVERIYLILLFQQIFSKNISMTLFDTNENQFKLWKAL